MPEEPKVLAAPPSPDLAANRPAVYQVVAQHWAHAEQIRWTLLYNYLMASTILLLAWATVFTSERPARGGILLVLSLAGTLISALWVALGARASGFVEMYADLGVTIESSIHAGVTSEAKIPGPLTSARDYRKAIKGIARLAPSRFVLKCVPSMFVILYLVLTLVSLKYALLAH